MTPNIQAFFDATTWTVSYVVFDEPSGHCAIIDPVLDYSPNSGRTHTVAADQLIEFVRTQQLSVAWILETHAHADHLSAANYIKNILGGKTAIGDNIPIVQQTFKKIFNLNDEFIPDGSHFDHLLSDGETFQVGKLTAKAISVSGHTPADMAYQFDDVKNVDHVLKKIVPSKILSSLRDNPVLKVKLTKQVAEHLLSVSSQIETALKLWKPIEQGMAHYLSHSYETREAAKLAFRQHVVSAAP